MEFTPLRYLQTIARTGHMTKAARQLGVSQPALSTMLRKLEREVGAELMHRTPKGVELTEAGRVFLTHAEDALRRADDGLRAVRELLGLAAGSIRVGGGATAVGWLLPAAVSAFRASHPGVRFYVREAGSASVAASIASGELDLGLVTLPLPEGARRSGDLLTEPLMEDELRLIVPSRHALAARRSFRWSDLAGAAVVAFEAGSAVRDVIDRASTAHGVALDTVMELRSIDAIRRMVHAGVGVGFVSRLALSPDEGLRCRDGGLTRPLALARSSARVPSPAVAEFERVLRQTAKAPERSKAPKSREPEKGG